MDKINLFLQCYSAAKLILTAAKRGDIIVSDDNIECLKSMACEFSRFLYVEMTCDLCIEPTNSEENDS